MNNKELIALYFENKLSAEQTSVFQNLLNTDAQFRAQFEFEKQVKKAIISTKKDALKARFKELEQRKTKKNTSKYYKIAIAASLIIALGFFGLWKKNEPINNEKLFATYFEPYANVIAPSARGNDTEDLKTEAFRYYDTHNYNLALTKFEVLYSTTQTSYYLFYQAICQLQLNNTNKAISLLEAHKQYQDKVSQHRNWYLALAYLKANNLKKSQEILKQIISKKNYKYKAAETILKKLD